ncbi:ninein isoform X2 [Pseudomyrmex gracilis]|uniref:ninein isoform X2 n=1 Tax=Pseudomyrmex gracilis TaxID=219809 RepID=UPI000994BCA5|nr:ninein isoform X2 [Pseudomyrmex gracilis]
MTDNKEKILEIQEEKSEEQENESKSESVITTPVKDAAEAAAEITEDVYKDKEDKIEDKAESDFQDEEIPEEPEILFTDKAIEELKKIDKMCITLADEIQELKNEIVEFSEKPELTKHDGFMILEKQTLFMLKLEELDGLTQMLHETRQEMLREMENLKLDIVEKKEDVEKEERDIEPFQKLLEEDIPRVEYPENKLPRVIVCGYTETDLPKIVLANNEQKEREKCLEKLTDKLTESLTMQEKLVEENVQLEGGKYKLEQALLEKDTAVESLQKKVCDLQTEVRIIVKENKVLKQTVASLNQRASKSTCSYTCPGVISSCPSTPLTSPRLYVSAQPRDERQCPQSQIAGTSSPPKTVYCSPRLTGGGSKTEDQRNIDDNTSENKEMYSRSPVVVKPMISEGICPAELEDKLVSCSTSTKQLKQQLDTMESKVHTMQMELANVQRERQQLHQQRKLLKCTGPCAPCTCCPPSSTITPGLPVTSISSKVPVPAGAIQVTAPIGSNSFTNGTMGPSIQQQLSDLREQYARLQDDYKSKLCEVSCMRTEAEKLKQESRDANEEKERMEIKLIDAQERLKLLETEKNKYEGLKEQLIEQEQALIVAKQRFRESQDELEELRSLIQDQAAQLESYRNKYLQAQEQVEEQRRQLDLMEMDNARMNENVTLEIGRVKNQFQEKLAELAPLPDMLKQMQMKMQEAQQMRLVAERNCEDLSRELLGCKDQIQSLQNELDVLRTEHLTFQEKGSTQVDEIEKKCSELRHENERLKNTLTRSEEHRAQLQKSIDEKMHENVQLSSMLEQIREDSARQVVRTKERCETMRKTMQGQIAEMERQLAQCRATARAAQRDRDEIRQKMQSQINNLNEAFKHAQGRIKSLQGHVNYLKTSYSNIFIGQGETPTTALASVLPDDSCDCNY